MKDRISFDEIQLADAVLNITRWSARPDGGACEHGDHPAPAGSIFCSEACKACESADFDASVSCCAGICGFPNTLDGGEE